MTSTQNPDLNPRDFTTPLTASRIRRGITLPAQSAPYSRDLDEVLLIVSDHEQGALYQTAYRVGHGWGRIAVEQEIELADATQARSRKAIALIAASIRLIPGYTEV